MQSEISKKYNREYQIIVTVAFPLYFSRKEEDDGVEIPHELIKKQVVKMIENKEYDVQEEPME